MSFPARSKGSALDEQNQVAGAAGVCMGGCCHGGRKLFGGGM